MKEENNGVAKQQVSDFKGEKISRKEAIKKTGYAALSAATMMILLSKNANADENNFSERSFGGKNFGDKSFGDKSFSNKHSGGRRSGGYRSGPSCSPSGH